MYSSSIVYRILAAYLNERLAGYEFVQAFSTGRDELLLYFRQGGKSFQLRLRYAEGEMFFLYNEPHSLPGNRTQAQFKSAYGATLSSVETVLNSRALIMRFSNGDSMVFKGYGRFANVLHFGPENSQPLGLFRLNVKKDREAMFSDFTPNPFPIMESPVRDEASLQKLLPFLQTQVLEVLQPENLFDLELDAQQDWINSLGPRLDSLQPLYAEAGHTIALNFAERPGTEPEEKAEVLKQYAQEFLRDYHFHAEKDKRLRECRAALKHFERLRRELGKKLLLLQNRRSFKELGDIVLGNVHAIGPGVSEALLSDFYTGERIRIKLDPTLNAAGNAAKLYKKAQNEGKELDMTRRNLELASANHEVQLQILEKLEAASAFSDLKRASAQKESAAGQGSDVRPYREIEFKGFLIWVGKNAKGNDQLLKLAGKNDLWFHARGVQGSHVILKKKGSDWPKDVIQHAANQAALNSKAKAQALVPVIMCERKFVSKPKNAAPGAVKVVKETIVDAYTE